MQKRTVEITLDGGVCHDVDEAANCPFYGRSESGEVCNWPGFTLKPSLGKPYGQIHAMRHEKCPFGMDEVTVTMAMT